MSVLLSQLLIVILWIIAFDIKSKLFFDEKMDKKGRIYSEVKRL